MSPIERIAHRSACIAVDEASRELVGDRVVDDEALGRDARLAVVDVRAFTAMSRGASRSARRHDDERIAAAELEHGLLECSSGGRGHARAGALAAGERHGCDARVAMSLRRARIRSSSV